MKKNEKSLKFFRFFFIILFIIFISLFISQKTGYYDYDTHRKTVLTKEAMQKFENDLKKGKNVSLNDYVGDIEKDYGNKISNTGLYLSRKIDNIVKSGIELIFKSISKMVEND